MQCLGEDFTGLPGIQTPFVVDCLEKVINAVTGSCEKLFSEEILVQANGCLTLFVNSLQDILPGKNGGHVKA